MSEEEQEAIEELKKFSNLIIEGGIPNSIIVNKLKIVFNLIDKLQKENAELKEEIEIHEETQNDLEHEILRYEEEIEIMNKEKYKGGNK